MLQEAPLKKMAMILALVSMFLGVLAVLIEQSGGDRLVIAGITFLTGQMFLLVVFLASVAILLKLSLANVTSQLPESESRNAWLITGVIGLSIIALLFLGARKWHSQGEIVEQFYKVYYKEDRLRTTFLGIASLQYPTDNWAIQEIIAEIKPDFIVETGTNAGGTALFYATILEMLNGKGRILTVDIQDHDPRVVNLPVWEKRVRFLRGSSVSSDVFEKINNEVRGHKVLVTLDSLHTKDHVLKELQLYSQLVSLNSYLIVQDTQLMGHPIPLSIYSHEGREGPFEAVQEFLANNDRFVIDHSRERFLLTANPSGFLKRVK
jgi:cephalosporin hydroxylase